VDDARLRVCLEREIECFPVRLRFRDWPGYGRPIVHFAFSDSGLITDAAAALAPRQRVLSLRARLDVAYQVCADDLAGLLRAFGFERPVLLGEGCGGVVPVLVAAWQPALVGGVLLVGGETASVDDLAARSLRDCPPDWDALLGSVTCPFERIDRFSLEALDAFLATIDAA
jgi:pimeloyl-ACP methyl ester carboxylesterase